MFKEYFHLGIRRLFLKYDNSQSNFGIDYKIKSNLDFANEYIQNQIEAKKPLMISRFGATEALNLSNYIGIIKQNKSYINFYRGKLPPWWWVQSYIDQLQNWSGVFPNNKKTASKFCYLMLEDVKQIDILGSWRKEEFFFQDYLKTHRKFNFYDLEPFFSKNPWTKALAGKKVLVVHPFEESIRKQYKLKNKLFKNGLLPDFELITLRSVQSLGGNKNYIDWFHALNSMKEKISATDFDIALIGAGAYGLPLAAHVKKLGKIGFHLGGVLQLLFGIKGNRWEKNNDTDHFKLFNKYWKKPLISELSQNASEVEDSCYW